MAKLKLSVVICTLNRAQSLRKCLASLALQSLKPFEVIIVDGSGTGPAARFIEWHPALPVRLLKAPHKGLAYARDSGWRAAAGDLVSWIDDDVIVSPGWAEEIINVFLNHPEVGGVSGPTIIPPRLLKNRKVFWWYSHQNLLSRLWIRYVLDGDPYQVGKLTRLKWWTPGSNFSPCLSLNGLQPVDYLEACNMTLRRHLVEKVGGFDLKFKGTGEWCEVDLARRVNRLGYDLVFSPKAMLEHHVSQSGPYVLRKNIGERALNFSRYIYKNIWYLRRNR